LLSFCRRSGEFTSPVPIADGGTNRILGQHRTVNLHRRQRQFFHDVCVFDAHRVVHGAAFDPLRGQRRAGDGRAAAEGLELGLFDHLGLGVHANLQAHYVAALWRAHQARAHLGGILVERAHIPRVVVVIDYLVAVCHWNSVPGFRCQVSVINGPALKPDT
jgi:hypothetical protein